ncbi:hypothetical protein ACFVIN_13800, partial [Streptomyces prasinus]
ASGPAPRTPGAPPAATTPTPHTKRYAPPTTREERNSPPRPPHLGYTVHPADGADGPDPVDGPDHAGGPEAPGDGVAFALVRPAQTAEELVAESGGAHADALLR